MAKALVVDDDTVSRLVLAHMLRRSGWDISEADDVAPALELTKNTTFDVVFSDYAMPGGTGIDLLTAMQSRPVMPQFVLVTGVVEHSAVGRDVANHVDYHLTKPISTRALGECLQALRANGIAQ